jgi:isopenicillin N synthase-like dioxygenase
MIEIDHDDLRYSGQDGEEVQITVLAHGTLAFGTFTLKGITKPLPSNGLISFKLESQPNNNPLVVQLILDFATPGNYRVVVHRVTNQRGNQCVHTWLGPPVLIKTFSFFINQ